MSDRIKIPSKHDKSVNRDFYAYLRKKATERELEHIKSGKLSAGRLGDPTLEAILYVIGVPPKAFDDYTLGIFKRGSQVEDAYIESLELKEDEVQKELLYRNVIGFEDAYKEMPIEVKSIKNSQVRYINPENTKQYKSRVTGQLTPEYQGVSAKYAMQGCLYALARGDEPEYKVIYVSADDLRPFAHIIKTEDVKPLVDERINLFNSYIESGTLPKWQPLEEWQRQFTQYSKYPEWIDLDSDTALAKLKTQFPDAYKKLQSLKGERPNPR